MGKKVTKPISKTRASASPLPAKNNTPRRRTYRRKDDVVLEAAEKCFLEFGYASTSMDLLADRAGVSKRTIYSNFQNKEQLFAAVIRKRCGEILPGALDDVDLYSGDPETLLVELGAKFLKNIYSKQQVNLYQTVVAASRRFPKVGKMMFDGPMAETRIIFEKVLDAQIALGNLDLPDTHKAAAHLCALLKTDLHMQLVFAQPASLTKERIREIATSAVQLFLYGAATDMLREKR